MAVETSNSVLGYKGDAAMALGQAGSGNINEYDTTPVTAIFNKYALAKAQANKDFMDAYAKKQADNEAKIAKESEFDLTKAWANRDNPRLLDELSKFRTWTSENSSAIADDPKTALEFKTKADNLKALIYLSGEQKGQYDTFIDHYNANPQQFPPDAMQTALAYAKMTPEEAAKHPLTFAAASSADYDALAKKGKDLVGKTEKDISGGIDPQTGEPMKITLKESDKQALKSTYDAQYDNEKDSNGNPISQDVAEIFTAQTPDERLKQILGYSTTLANHYPQFDNVLKTLYYKDASGNVVPRSTDAWTPEEIQKYNALPQDQKDNYPKVRPDDAANAINTVFPDPKQYYQIMQFDKVSKDDTKTYSDMSNWYAHQNYQQQLDIQKENTGYFTDVRSKGKDVTPEINKTVDAGGSDNYIYAKASGIMGLPQTNIKIGNKTINALNLDNAKLTDTQMQFSDQSKILDGGVWKTVLQYNKEHPNGQIVKSSTNVNGDYTPGYDGYAPPKLGLLTFGTTTNYTPTTVPKDPTQYVMFGMNVPTTGGGQVTIFNVGDINSTDYAETLNRLMKTDKLSTTDNSQSNTSSTSTTQPDPYGLLTK